MTQDTIGYIRVILPRYAEAGQRQAMEAHNIKRVVQEGGKRQLGSFEDLVTIVREGTAVAVLHALLLANPRDKRKKGGTRKAFWTALDAIEAKGGVIWELYTGLRTDKLAERDRMTREAIDALARGRHKTSQSDKRGRPKKVIPPALLAKAKLLWESRKLKTWADVKKRLPKGVTLRDCWNEWGARNTEEE